MTGALWAKRGECDISREARDEGKRKKYIFFIFLFPSSRASRSCRAPREISRSPRLAHKAPVMQAIPQYTYLTLTQPYNLIG